MRAAIFWSPCPARRLRADPDRGVLPSQRCIRDWGFKRGNIDLRTRRRDKCGGTAGRLSLSGKGLFSLSRFCNLPVTQRQETVSGHPKADMENVRRIERVDVRQAANLGARERQV